MLSVPYTHQLDPSRDDSILKFKIVKSSDTTSSSELADDLDDEIESSGFRPSKTLIAALFILAVTLGIAGYAGFTLWSLSDHSTAAEQPTTDRQDGSITLP
jgi:hypothetical protein